METEWIVIYLLIRGICVYAWMLSKQPITKELLFTQKSIRVFVIGYISWRRIPLPLFVTDFVTLDVVVDCGGYCCCLLLVKLLLLSLLAVVVVVIHVLFCCFIILLTISDYII